MIMAPSTYVLLKYCTIDRCSSEVPGGVSTIRKSTSPQSTSRKNCFIKPVMESMQCKITIPLKGLGQEGGLQVVFFLAQMWFAQLIFVKNVSKTQHIS